MRGIKTKKIGLIQSQIKHTLLEYEEFLEKQKETVLRIKKELNEQLDEFDALIEEDSAEMRVEDKLKKSGGKVWHIAGRREQMKEVVENTKKILAQLKKKLKN